MEARDGGNDNAQPLIAHDISLQPGSQITLTLADTNILSDTQDVILADSRLNDLAKFHKQSKERQRVKEYKDRVGETGITTVAVEDDSDNDVATVKTLSAAVVTKDDVALTSFKPGARMQNDEESVAPATAWVPVASVSAQSSSKSNGFKKRKVQESNMITNWDEVFNLCEQGNMVEPAAISPTKPEEWVRRPKLAVASEDEDVLQTLDLIKHNTKEGKDKLQIIVKDLMNDAPSMPQPELDDSLIMSRTEEFTKTLPSPLDAINESQHGLSGEDLSKRKGIINVTANQTSTSGTMKELISSDKGLEEIFDQTSLDGGLATALRYLKAGGAMNEERWKLGRHGIDQKKPLLDDEASVNTLEDSNGLAARLKLDYVDAWGNVMNAKDAFRQMSYKFHGKGPGKKKTEKLLRRMVLDKASKTSDSINEDLNSGIFHPMKVGQQSKMPGKAGQARKTR